MELHPSSRRTRTLRRSCLLAVSVASALLASACAAHEDPSTSSTPGAVQDSSSGSVTGVVTDDSLLPLQGIRLVLGGELEAVTGPDGSFGFSNVAPGSYALKANASGYVAAERQVEVRPGEVTEIALLLVPRTADTPYHTTMHETGLIGCAVNSQEAYTATVLVNCEAFYIAGQHEIDRYILPFHIGSLERIVGFWSETVFRSSQALGSTMQIRWTLSGESEPSQNTWILFSIAIETGPSPVRFSFPVANVVKNMSVPVYGGDMCTLQDCWLINNNYAGNDSVVAGPAHFGVMAQQRYEQYLTIFYNGAVPEEFAITPDS